MASVSHHSSCDRLCRLRCQQGLLGNTNLPFCSDNRRTVSDVCSAISNNSLDPYLAANCASYNSISIRIVIHFLTPYPSSATAKGPKFRVETSEFLQSALERGGMFVWETLAAMKFVNSISMTMIEQGISHEDRFLDFFADTTDAVKETERFG